MTAHSTPAEQAATIAATVEAAVTLAADELADGRPVNALEQLAEVRAQLSELERLAALVAREQGEQWDTIGQAVGISKQAAHKKWAQAANPARRLVVEFRAAAAEADPYGTTPAVLVDDELVVENAPDRPTAAAELVEAIARAESVVEPTHPARVVDPVAYDQAQELLEAVTQVREAEARVDRAIAKAGDVTKLDHRDDVFAAARLARARLVDAKVAAGAEAVSLLDELERLAVGTLGELAGKQLAARRKGRK